MGTRRKLRRRTAKEPVQINNRSKTLRVKDVVKDRITLDFIGRWKKKMNPKVVALYDEPTNTWGLLLFHANCKFADNRNNCVKRHIHLVQGRKPILLIKSKAKKTAVDTALFKTGKELFNYVVEKYGDLLAQTD